MNNILGPWHKKLRQ